MTLKAAARIAAAVTLPALAACGKSGQDLAAVPVEPAAAEYREVLATLDAQLAAARAEAGRYPDSWGGLERIAGLHLERAQLSGDYGDYASAQQTLESAAGLAGNIAVVCATRARLAFALHRLSQAREALLACEQRFGVSGGELPDPRGLAAEIDFYSGRYQQALAAMRKALLEQETIPGLTRLSLYHAKTGNTSEALALLDRAERLYFGDSAQLRAWLKLQRAIVYLESGRWEDAQAHLLAAERELRGWWLVEEHLAEVKALLGETEAARAIYRGVIERAGQPEYLDALAQLEREHGDEPAARDLIARAEAIYRERLGRWPEAAAGHALDHFLRFGSNPAEAVALAEANARHRPYGDAQIQLARAYLRAGRLPEAQSLIGQILKTPWNTAALHLLAAQVHNAAGDRAAAEAARARALRLNPRAERQYGK